MVVLLANPVCGRRYISRRKAVNSEAAMRSSSMKKYDRPITVSRISSPFTARRHMSILASSTSTRRSISASTASSAGSPLSSLSPSQRGLEPRQRCRCRKRRSRKPIFRSSSASSALRPRATARRRRSPGSQDALQRDECVDAADRANPSTGGRAGRECRVLAQAEPSQPLRRTALPADAAPAPPARSTRMTRVSASSPIRRPRRQIPRLWLIRRLSGRQELPAVGKAAASAAAGSPRRRSGCVFNNIAPHPLMACNSLGLAPTTQRRGRCGWDGMTWKATWRMKRWARCRRHGPGTSALAAAFAAALIATFNPPIAAVAASRIKDLANVEGVRDNQLIGYGLVVGLNGTGDTINNSPSPSSRSRRCWNASASTSAARRSISRTSPP